MNNFIVKISSPFPCVIKINNIEKVLNNKCENLFLKVENEESFCVSYYPLNSTFLTQKIIPATANINLKDLYKNDPEKTSITIYKNNFLHINLKPFLIFKTPTLKTKKETITLNNKKHEALLSIGKPCVFSINTDNNIYYKTLDFDCLDYKISSTRDLIFVEFIGQKSEILTLKYDDNYKIIDNLDINHIEYGKDKITIHSPLFDMAGHGKLIEYDITKKTTTRNITLTYNDKKPNIITNTTLIPYAFFEAVKVKNFKLARNYLSHRLSSSLTDNHIETYFNDFIKITPSPFCDLDENKVCLIYKDNNVFTAKEFDIEIKENKIENIILNE